MTTSPDQNYTSWHVGMKVVLIDDNWGPRHDITLGVVDPVKGVVYTVRSVQMSPSGSGFVCITLNEIRNPILKYRSSTGERLYRAYRFRPVQTRKTSIEIFTAMLSPKPAKAKKVRA